MLLKASIAAGLLIAATLFYFYGMDRYTATGGDLLAHHFDGQILVLQNEAVDQSAHLSWVIPHPKSDLIRLKGLFSVIDVVAGNKPWQMARVTLTARSNAGKWRWFAGSGVIAKTGSQKMINASRVIALPSAFDQLRVTMQLAKATGSLVVHDISLHAVNETKVSVWVMRLLLGLWAALGLGIILLLYVSRVSNVVLVGVMGLSLLLLMPGPQKAQLDRAIFGQLDRVVTPLLVEGDVSAAKKPKALIKPLLRRLLPAGVAVENVIHFLLYFGLTVLVLMSSRRDGRVQYQLALGLMVFAVMTEVLQNFSPGRTAGLLDAGVNLFGVVIGAIGVMGVRSFIVRSED